MLPEYSTILLPVDGSECSKAATTHAISVARMFKSKLIVLHVVNVEEEFLVGTYAEEVINKLREEGEKILDEIEEIAKQHGVQVEKRIESGNVAKRILEVSEEVGADLIVIGSQGKSKITEFLVGSVSEKVFRHSEIPVLSVRVRKE